MVVSSIFILMNQAGFSELMCVHTMQPVERLTELYRLMAASMLLVRITAFAAVHHWCKVGLLFASNCNAVGL
jgi:hypothetical protein